MIRGEREEEEEEAKDCIVIGCVTPLRNERVLIEHSTRALGRCFIQRRQRWWHSNSRKSRHAPQNGHALKREPWREIQLNDASRVSSLLLIL